MGGDPVAAGCGISLSRPVGNLTGVSSLTSRCRESAWNLHECVRAKLYLPWRLIRPVRPQGRIEEPSVAARRHLGLRLVALNAHTEEGVVRHVNRVHEMRAGDSFSRGSFFAYRSQQLPRRRSTRRTPVTQSRDFPLAGGLMTMVRLKSVASRGAHTSGAAFSWARRRPHAVPRVTNVELLINLKAASTLGLSVPPSVLTSADGVIE